MTRYISFMLAMVLALVSQAANSQKVIELNLKQCLEMALQNDQRVKLAETDQVRLGYQIKQTRGTGLPQISGSGNFQNFLKLPTQLIPGEFFGQPGTLIPVQFGTNYNMSGGIQISQLVYNQSFLVSLQIARRMLEQSNLEIEKNKQNIVYDAAQLYYLAVLTNQQIGYLNKTLRNTDTLTEIVRVHLDHQLIKQVDYDRVNVNRTNLQSEISNLDLMLAQQLNMLKYFTGISPDDSLILITALADDNMLLPNTSYTDNQLILREIDQQKKLLNLQIDLAHSQNLPYLSAFGDFSYNSQQNDFGKLFSDKKGWLGTSVIGLSLNVPIFSGGQRYYQLKQYQVQSLQMDLNRDYAAKQIETSIRNANLKVKNLEQTIVTQQKNVTLADEVYNVIFDQYRQGYASLTDLLSAGSARITAQSAHAQSLVQLRIAWLDLLKANGNIMDIIK